MSDAVKTEMKNIEETEGAGVEGRGWKKEKKIWEEMRILRRDENIMEEEESIIICIIIIIIIIIIYLV